MKKNRPSIEQCEAFVCVSALGSFSLAALELGLAQSTVSSRLHGLEVAVGRQLFERFAGRVELTTSGRAVLPLAEAFASTGAEMVQQSPKGHGRRLRLGANNTAAAGVVPSLIRSYTARYLETAAGAAPDVRVASTKHLMMYLMSREVDVAFVNTDLANSSCQILWEQRTDIVLVVQSEHPCAGRTVPFADLSEDEFIAFNLGTPEKVLQRLNMRSQGAVRIVAATNSTALVKALVLEGVGLAFMPRDSVIRELLSGRLAIITLQGDEAPQSSLALVKWKGVRLDKSVIDFVQFVQALKEVPTAMEGS